MLRSAAASAGLLAAGVGADASPVAVENGNYRSATAAPETWQAFARQLQRQVEQRLAGDDAKARRFQDYPPTFLQDRVRTIAPTRSVAL